MKRRSCGGRFAILCSMNALAPAAPVARQSLVRRPSLFWILHGAGWLGYFAFNYLIALAHGKPGGYLAVVAASTVMGFGATIARRNAASSSGFATRRRYATRSFTSARSKNAVPPVTW